ncbi:MAG TPA: RNA polymerase sigma factor [bacterium]|nr:RNA polymerase sigma factor [bacterium]
MGLFSSKKQNFEKIYDSSIEKIYRFIFIKVSSQEIAEDLTSEVFLRGWKSFQEKEDIKNINAFLYQIARNLVVDYYRQKGKAQVVSIETWEITDEETDLESDAVFQSELKEIQKAISKLKDDYQNVIIWHYLDELSIKEIARILDKPEGTVRVMLHRALKSLKSGLNTD